jgi:DNA repair protein RadC
VTEKFKARRPAKPNTAHIVALVRDIAALKQEHSVCITLDSNYRVIAKHTVFIGTLTSSLMHPREIFQRALGDSAAGIVIAHNHPSGVATPTESDLATTQQIAAAGLIMGIPLEDHIVVAGDIHFSFRKHNLIAGLLDD